MKKNESKGLKVEYFGNPFVDKYEFSDKLGEKILLLPGSRRQEIEKFLPVIMELVRNEKVKNEKFLMKLASKDHIKYIRDFEKKYKIDVYKIPNLEITFDEIKKYEDLIQGEIKYAYYDKIRDKVFELQSHLEKIGIDRKSCHIDLVPENFIEDENGRVYLIDWEYSAMNDPMWDLAALFIESNYRKSEEGDFFKYYYSEKTPVSIAKIMIYKILQDFLWSLWTIYKEEQGAEFGSYGQDRYNRCLKNLKEYIESYEK